MFEDGSYVLVSDRGPVYQGIVTVAVSADGHEAEMKAPMWGFLRAPDGRPIVDLDRWIAVSASLEGSGELSEEALAAGVTDGSRAFWASDTAAPFRYLVSPPAVDAFDLAIDILDQSVVNDESFGPLLVTELEIANRRSASAGALVLTVERTGALAGADWIEFATVAGDGTTAVVSVPDLHAAECFRVLAQPVVSRTR